MSKIQNFENEININIFKMSILLKFGVNMQKMDYYRIPSSNAVRSDPIL